LQNPRAQALHSLLARFLHANSLGLRSAQLVVLSCVGRAVAWLWLAVRVHRQGDPVAAVMICDLAVIMATPISWNDQFARMVPALAIIGAIVVVRRGRSFGSELFHRAVYAEVADRSAGTLRLSTARSACWPQNI
jgi:hypothetical protein